MTKPLTLLAAALLCASCAPATNTAPAPSDISQRRPHPLRAGLPER